MASEIFSPLIESFKSNRITVSSTNHQLTRASREKTSDSCKDIWESVKTGDINALKSFHASDPAEIYSRDENGHLLTHWAALHGHLNILEWLISMNVPFKEATLHSLGHHPIHWACANNHISVLDCLLNHGTSIESRDSRGATPLIIAAQYNKIPAAAFLMNRGADLHAVDAEGDTALHWAASRGSADMCRVLVYAGLDPHAVDLYQQSVLHRAVISNDLRTVKDLVHIDGVDLSLRDKRGKSALDFAIGRRNEKIIALLQHEADARQRKFPKLTLKSILFGPVLKAKASSAPLKLLMFLMVFWAYPLYFVKTLPLTVDEHPFANGVFLSLGFLFWICMYHASSIDPGFLPRNTRAYDQAMKSFCFQQQRLDTNMDLQMNSVEVDSPSSNQPNPPSTESQLSSLCHTCRCVRPQRSSHCRVCNRCVRFLDHHCPYINNCVGFYNRNTFLLASTLATVLQGVAFYLGLHMWRLEGWVRRPDYIIGFLIMTLFTVLNLNVFFGSWHNACNYVATNERLRWKRYPYLQRNGDYFNPYASRSILKNIIMYFNLKPNPKECPSSYFGDYLRCVQHF